MQPQTSQKDDTKDTKKKKKKTKNEKKKKKKPKHKTYKNLMKLMFRHRSMSDDAKQALHRRKLQKETCIASKVEKI